MTAHGPSRAAPERELDELLDAVDRLAGVLGRQSWSASPNVADAVRAVVDARIDLARATFDVTARAARIEP